MATQTREDAQSLVARPGQRLIAIPDEEDGEPIVRYFVEQEAAQRFVDARMAAGRPLSWIGAWSHLDDNEVDPELDRIRHGSQPTPPIDEEDPGL